MEKQPQPIVDYEGGCIRCGKCCSPGIQVNGEWVRFKNIRCIFLDDNNSCTIYPARKEIMGMCRSPQDLGEEERPQGCAFGGKIREISGKEQQAVLDNPPNVLWELVLTNLFKWR